MTFVRMLGWAFHAYGYGRHNHMGSDIPAARLRLGSGPSPASLADRIKAAGA